jgi:hypothetical protein
MKPGFTIHIERVERRFRRRTQYRWRIVGRNNRVLAVSSETYTNLSDLRDNLHTVTGIDRQIFGRYGVGEIRVEWTYDGGRSAVGFTGERG